MAERFQLPGPHVAFQRFQWAACLARTRPLVLPDFFHIFFNACDLDLFGATEAHTRNPKFPCLLNPRSEGQGWA